MTTTKTADKTETHFSEISRLGFETVPLDESDPYTIFGDDREHRYTFKITGEHHADTLFAEILEANGGLTLDQVSLVIKAASGEDDTVLAPSKDTPHILLISSEKPLNQKATQAALAAHDPEKATAPSGPSVLSVDLSDPEVAKAVEALQDGDTLTTKQISGLLKTILS